MLNKLGVRGIGLSMNKTIALSALSIMFVIFFAFHIPVEAQKQEVLGYWQFEKGYSKKVKDSSGMSNDGVIQGDCKWVEGKFDGGLQVGDNGWVSVEHKPISESLTNAITMAGWMNVQMYVSEVVYIISEGGDYFLRSQLHVIIDPGFNINGWKICWADPNFGTEMGVWYHLAVTYDGEKIVVYVNGEKVGETALSGNIPVGGPLCLGTVGWHPGSGSGKVVLDEVLMANYAFTEEEINKLMKSGLYGFAVKPAGKLSATWSSIKSGY